MFCKPNYLLKAEILTLKNKIVYPDQKKHFSFIFDNNKLINIGINNYNTNNKFIYSLNYGVKKLHSEVAAVYKYRRNLEKLKGTILVNVRVNYKGEFKMAKPCEICQQWIKLIGFKKIYYTDWNGNWNKL